MTEKLKSTKKTGTKQYIAGYIILVVVSALWAETNDLSLWLAVTFSLLIATADIFSHISNKFIALIYTRKKEVAISVLAGSIIISSILYSIYPLHESFADYSVKTKTALIIQFLLQGAIVGVTVRMLVLNLLAGMIRASNVAKARFLILLLWTVFIILLPTNLSHRSLSAIFILGVGFGFYYHYASRPQDKKGSQSERLKQNILAIAAQLGKEVTPTEKEAIELYSKQKWKNLEYLLSKNDETDLLTFIKLSMLRKRHKYDAALNIIKDNMGKSNPETKHFYHLHYALNESDRFDNKGEWREKEQIFKNLESAYEINPNCLLTCVTLSLRISSEIDHNNPDQERAKRALSLIWHAMKLYEKKDIPQMLSLVTGMTVPVTYTFLLDTYGYVLLKCGRIKFAKALILQCLFQDPTYSASYLHLAEWYQINNDKYVNESKFTSSSWRKAAMLCLQIALKIEKENDDKSVGTLISKKSESLFNKIN